MSVIRVWYPSWMKIWRSVYFMVDTCKQRFCMETHKRVHHTGSLTKLLFLSSAMYTPVQLSNETRGASISPCLLIVTFLDR